MTWLNDWLIEHISFYKLALKHADPRTKDWFLVWHDPIPAATLLIIYLLIILLGPRYMRHREAFHIPTAVLFTYNMIHVVLSAYVIEEIVVGVYRSRYNLICQRMVISYDKNEMKITNALWFYYFSKAIEFMDTIFIILRKRFAQITFLHVFHHATMFFNWWFIMSWVPTGQTWFGTVLNTIVHVFMYSYYGLATIPSLRGKLWWKRYLTLLQLIQFVVVCCHVVSGLIYGCDYSFSFLWFQCALCGYMIIMLIFFMNFYIQEYVARNNDKKKLDILSQRGTLMSNKHE